MRHKKLPTLKFYNYCSKELAKGKKHVYLNGEYKMYKLKEIMMIVDSNINIVEIMIKDSEIRLSDIKRAAVKYCLRDEGKIENQQEVVNDLKSQLKMTKTIKKGLILILEREEQKEKSHGNGPDLNNTTNLTFISSISQEA